MNNLIVEKLKNAKEDSYKIFSLNGIITYAKILSNYDGDTADCILIHNDNIMRFKVRFYGYDSPEMKPPLNNKDRDEIKKKAIESKKKLWKYCSDLDDLNINANLFVPIETNTVFDKFASTAGGIMPGTNIMAAGAPGVGKTTVLLDLLSTAHKSGKKVLFISTPKGKNWFYELFQLGESPDFEDYQSYKGSSYDTPYIQLVDIEDARRVLPENVFRQEYEAKFIDSGGEVFQNLTKNVTNKHCIIKFITIEI